MARGHATAAEVAVNAAYFAERVPAELWEELERAVTTRVFDIKNGNAPFTTINGGTINGPEGVAVR